MHEMQGKRVLVTGAGTGIGQGIALAFAQAGAAVAVHYSRSAAGAEAVVGSAADAWAGKIAPPIASAHAVPASRQANRIDR